MRSADKLTIFMWRLSWNLGASNSWNPQWLSRPVMGLLYLLPFYSFMWKAESTPEPLCKGHCAAGRIMSKKSLYDIRRIEWTIITRSLSQIQNEYFQNTVPIFSLLHRAFPKTQNFCMKWILSAEGRSCTYRSTCWLVNLLVSPLQ
jgi:hypothetical protein